MNNFKPRIFFKRNKFVKFIYYKFLCESTLFNALKNRRNRYINAGVRINTKLVFRGNNNLVSIGTDTIVKNVRILVYGDNNVIKIGSASFLEGTELWIEDSNGAIFIGDNVFIGPSHLAVTEGRTITVGDDCMISANSEIRTGDSHSILDALNKRINFSADVQINDHVWIASGSKILKGVTLGSNSIVAAGSIVTKNFTKGCLIGGVPAVVLKEDVNWLSERI